MRTVGWTTRLMHTMAGESRYNEPNHDHCAARCWIVVRARVRL